MDKIKIQFVSYPLQEWGGTFIPIGAGNLISYAKKQKFSFEIQWEDIVYLRDQEPIYSSDVLCFSCFLWNQKKSDEIAQKYKSLNPNGIIIYGGPNIPIPDYNEEFCEKWMNERPYVDYFVAGIGERLFVDILRNLKNSPRLLYKKENNRIKPTSTAYLDGTLDKILDEGENLKALFETNAGCPFKCAYCDWGGMTASKVVKMDDDVIKQTILKLCNKQSVIGISPIDANFGLYERDVEYLKLYLENKRPDQIWRTNGLAKNPFKYLKDIYQLIFDYDANKKDNKHPVTQESIAVQTWSENVLKIIDRGNIKIDQYKELISFIVANDKDPLTELIVGLPGETSESWLDCLQFGYDLGVKYTRINILELIHNTTLFSPEFMEKHQIKYREVFFKNEVKKLIYQNNSYDVNDLKLQHFYSWFALMYPHTILHEKLTYDSFKQMTLAFFDNINNMPFWSLLINEVGESFEKIYIDGDGSEEKELHYMTASTPFFHKRHLKMYKKNKSQADKELEMLL